MKRHWFALALTVVGCLKPDDAVLFDRDDGSAAGGSQATAGTGSVPTAGAHSGTDSGQYMAGAHTGGTSSAGGGGVNAGLGGKALGGGGGTGGDAPPVPVIESCDMVSGSLASELNGHCYRASEEELTFADAREACRLAGGHLVTIGSEEENELARDLHDGEHWLGATDELADDAPGVGTYVWVNEEPWEFSDWEEGQPNAFENDCPDEDGQCYEHCAFQTDEGDWNDRSCWHTIASICEWDVNTQPGHGGAGGASDASPNRPHGPR